MEVGGLTETVQVVSSAAVVDTTSTTAGAVLSSEMFEKIPLGRRMTDTLYLAPGVSGTTVGRANPSMSGASGLDNLYVVDGVNVTNTGYGAVGSYSIVFGSLGTATPFDFVKEVQVKTGGYEAEFGQALGGVVNVVTKSGSNELRGSVFGYSRPSALEAELQDRADRQRHGQHRRAAGKRHRHRGRRPRRPRQGVLLRRHQPVVADAYVRRPGRLPAAEPRRSRSQAAHDVVLGEGYVAGRERAPRGRVVLRRSVEGRLGAAAHVLAPGDRHLLVQRARLRRTQPDGQI